MAADGVEGLGEAALDRLRQLVAELLELREARLEVGPLGGELLQPRLLRLVLLVRERVDLAERLAAALQPLDRCDELLTVVAFGRLVGICLLEAAARLVRLRLDPRRLDLDGGDGFGSGSELLPQLDLGRTEAAQLGAELAAASRACVDLPAQRRLEVRHRDLERAHEALCERCTANEERIRLERVRRVGNGSLQARPQLVQLGCERSPPRLQLEQQRLGRLAREPELAARRVVPEAFRRHGGNRGREQLLLRDDRHLGHEPRRVSADEDDEAAEARVARPLEELEGAGRIVADDGGGASAQRRGDGPLAARLDLEQ